MENSWQVHLVQPTWLFIAYFSLEVRLILLLKKEKMCRYLLDKKSFLAWLPVCATQDGSGVSIFKRVVTMVCRSVLNCVSSVPIPLLNYDPGLVTGFLSAGFPYLEKGWTDTCYPIFVGLSSDLHIMVDDDNNSLKS